MGLAIRRFGGGRRLGCRGGLRARRQLALVIGSGWGCLRIGWVIAHELPFGLTCHFNSRDFFKRACFLVSLSKKSAGATPPVAVASPVRVPQRVGKLGRQCFGTCLEEVASRNSGDVPPTRCLSKEVWTGRLIAGRRVGFRRLSNSRGKPCRGGQVGKCLGEPTVWMPEISARELENHQGVNRFGRSAFGIPARRVPA